MDPFLQPQLPEGIDVACTPTSLLLPQSRTKIVKSSTEPKRNISSLCSTQSGRWWIIAFGNEVNCRSSKWLVSRLLFSSLAWHWTLVFWLLVQCPGRRVHRPHRYWRFPVLTSGNGARPFEECTNSSLLGLIFHSRWKWMQNNKWLLFSTLP